ncbi:glycosyltransferase family 39 protein [Nitrogeniibacter mangrovi]|uniref:Glycosyltransferase family 39 protein n=1 Tax=Nitrogeniibacter mangrovi TaxID=2016596 RepID=A0A6C1B2S7_9RHOO|nr:glycosyltransferase family 39 protein [Nitrogeniibacter mangrovi]QID17867.1 glycosyltransferase family 39 protein [Nitrogeniibacter mangrovi]
MGTEPRRGWTRALTALVFLLPLLAFFLRLGAAPLFDVDEGAFSEATREMFARGDFLSTYLDGANRFDKPILIYWLQALGYLLFGPTEWAFRLPSAVAAASWSYATWFFARERFGPAVALAALVVTSTALGPFVIGRAATADALLNLLLALTLFDAWRHLESGRRAPLLRSFVWMALGALTKGPIALIVPGAVTFLYCVSRGQWRRWLRAIADPIGWLIFVVLVVPWYAYTLGVHGQSFIDGFILKHNVKRFTGSLEGHTGSLFYYVIALPLLLLPWIGPLLASLRNALRDANTGVRRFLWLWALFVVAFFSLSGTKLPHYALYGATPLFILIAAHRESLVRRWPHLIAPTLFFALLPLLPSLFGYLSSTGAGNAFYRAQLSRALDLVTPIYYLVTILLLAGWLALAVFGRLKVWQTLAIGAAAQVLVLAAVVVPYLGDVVQGPVKDAGLLARKLSESAVRLRFDAPSFSVYALAATPHDEARPGQLVVTRIDRVPSSGYEVLFQEGGVVLLRRQAQ